MAVAPTHLWVQRAKDESARRIALLRSRRSARRRIVKEKFLMKRNNERLNVATCGKRSEQP